MSDRISEYLAEIAAHETKIAMLKNLIKTDKAYQKATGESGRQSKRKEIPHG